MLKLKYASVNPEIIRRIVKWLNDKELMKYSEQRHRTHSYNTQMLYTLSMNGSEKVYMYIYNGDTVIGTISAYIDQINDVADVGILIGEGGRKGYGTRAWGLFEKELEKQGVRKIEGGCMASNKPMLRIFEKNGMRLEGTRKYHFKNNDDLVMYGKLL